EFLERGQGLIEQLGRGRLAYALQRSDGPRRQRVAEALDVQVERGDERTRGLALAGGNQHLVLAAKQDRVDVHVFFLQPSLKARILVLVASERTLPLFAARIFSRVSGVRLPTMRPFRAFLIFNLVSIVGCGPGLPRRL